jgi:aprataxin
MSSAKKPKPTAEDVEPTSTIEKAKNVVKGWDPRNGLGVYLDKPETNPEGRVVEYDDDFVVIRDKFPKARYATVEDRMSIAAYLLSLSVHLLLMPRARKYYDQHPLHVLSQDTAFLAEVRKRVVRLEHLAAAELRRQHGDMSATDAPYQTAFEDLMSSPSPPTPEQEAALPPGRDWSRDVVSGVHTHPSMNHLHIHVFSRDMHSPCMKHKKHYLSFNTSFLVQMNEFPLEEGSERFAPGNWPSWDMKCWRCGKNFANKFAKLKEHLEEEFEAWKKE